MALDLDYDGRTFCAVENSANGEADARTRFLYHQEGRIVWGTYSGGRILKGVLLGRVDEAGRIHMRYEHINDRHEFRCGTCVSVAEELPDGRMRLHEAWLWADGDKSTGRTVLEEVAAGSA